MKQQSSIQLHETTPITLSYIDSEMWCAVVATGTRGRFSGGVRGVRTPFFGHTFRILLTTFYAVQVMMVHCMITYILWLISPEFEHVTPAIIYSRILPGWTPPFQFC